MSHLDARRFSTACARNRDPILAVLQRVLPARGTLLEVASGTGEHACHFAEHLPDLIWQPSDISPAARASVDAWRRHTQLVNLRPPIALDVTVENWPLPDLAPDGGGVVDALFNANMIHISPWDTCLGLMSGAGRFLRAGGVLVLYGPFRIDGAHTAPSNRQFDASLRQRDASWGVRDLEEVIAVASGHDLAYVERVPMPANNFTVVFHKR